MSEQPTKPRRERRADERATALTQPPNTMGTPQTTAVTRLDVQSSLHQGPVPSASEVEAYARIYPDAAQWFFDQASGQTSHRQRLESEQMAVQRFAVEQSVTIQKRGQLFGLVVALVFGIIAGVLIYTGHDLAGGVLGTIDLVGLVGVFIAGFVQKPPHP